MHISLSPFIDPRPKCLQQTIFCAQQVITRLYCKLTKANSALYPFLTSNAALIGKFVNKYIFTELLKRPLRSIKVAFYEKRSGFSPEPGHCVKLFCHIL